MSYAAEKARLQQAKSISWLEKRVDIGMGWLRALRQPELMAVMLFIQVASVYSSFKFGETYGGLNPEQVEFFSHLFCAFAILNLILFSWLLSGIKDWVLLLLTVLLVTPLTALDGVAVVGYSMSASPPDRLTRGYNEARQLMKNVAHSDTMLEKAQENAARTYPSPKIISVADAGADQARANAALDAKRASLREQGVEIIEPSDIMFYALSGVVGTPALTLKGWFSWLTGVMLPWVTIVGTMYAAYYAYLKLVRRRTAAIQYSELLKKDREAAEDRADREFDEFEEEDAIPRPEPSGSYVKPLYFVTEEATPDFTSGDDEPSEAQLAYKEVKRRVLRLELKPSIRHIAECYISETGKMIGKKQAERLHGRLLRKNVIVRDGNALNSPCIANRQHPSHKHYISAA